MASDLNTSKSATQHGAFMPQLFFKLDISPGEYHSFYQGIKKSVITRTEDGQCLQFPADELRRFVSHTGIQGRFQITFSRENKLVSLERVNKGAQ